MIIPVRCFTCGKILANLWPQYQSIIYNKTDENGSPYEKIDTHDPKCFQYKNENDLQTIEYIALDRLHIHKYCCRTIMLSHIDMIDKIIH